MNNFINALSIKSKLTFMITGVAVLILSIATAIILWTDISRFKEDFSGRMALVAQTAGNYAAVDVTFGDRSAAKQSLAKLDAIPSILNAHLFTQEGEYFASLNDAQPAADLQGVSSAINFKYMTDRLIITSPISFDSVNRGYIRLLVSTQELDAVIRGRVQILFFATLLLSGFAYLAATLIQKRISNRIVKLSDIAQEISTHKNFAIRAEGGGKDEIGQLFASFNDMLDRIESSREDLLGAVSSLKESEARFGSVFDSIPDAVMFADSNRKIRLNNPAVFEMFGYSNEELIGNTTSMLYPSKEAYLEQGRIRFNKKSTDEDFDAYEVQYKRKNGELFWTETRGAKVVTSTGEHIGFIGIFRDITERRLAEDKLKQHEKELQQILDAMIDGVVTIGQSGEIIAFSKSAENMFGYSMEEVVGKSINMLVPEEDVKQQIAELDMSKSGELSRAFGGGKRDLKATRKNGDEFPMRLFVAALPDSGDGRARYIATCHDVTLEREQEDMLRQSQKMEALGKLTGGIAHDFNNMLNVIHGYGELLRDQKPIEEDGRHRGMMIVTGQGASQRDIATLPRMQSFEMHFMPGRTHTLQA
jgi:PAS domain S-box-containing protein